MSGVPLRDATPPPVRWFTATSLAEAIGDSLARSLLPIIAVSMLGVGTATVGMISALGLVAFLLLSMPIGVLGDRLSQPTAMMTVSSAVRCLAALVGVGAWALGLMEGTAGLVVLMSIAAIVGIADVAFTAGRGILVPRMVAPEEIRSVFGRVQAASQVGSIAGPMVLSALLAVLAAPLAWLGVGVGYLLSILTQRPYRNLDRQDPVDMVPTRERHARQRSSWRQMGDGFGHLWRELTLRRITLASSAHNAAVMAANTLLPVLALSTLRLDASLFAAFGAAGAIAGILGAAVGSSVTRLLGLRATRISCSLVAGAAIALVLCAGIVVDVLPGPSAVWVAVYYCVSGFATSVASIAGADLVARLTPRRMIGSVDGAKRTVTMGIMPLSALGIGILGETAGMGGAGCVWLTITVAAAVPCLRLRGPGPGSPRTPRAYG